MSPIRWIVRMYWSWNSKYRDWKVRRRIRAWDKKHAAPTNMLDACRSIGVTEEAIEAFKKANNWPEVH